MTKNVDFIFDFSGPNAYLAHCVLGPLLERTGATITYIPVLLGGLFKGTNNQPPMMRFADSPAKLAYESLEFTRFIKRHKIPFKMNPHFPVNTVMAIRGLIVVQQEMAEKQMDYINAVSKAAWIDGKKLNDEDQLGHCITEAGLDANHIINRTKEADIKQQLISNTEAAVARGAFGVPTFYVGSEMFFGKERLGQLEEELNN